MDSTTTILASDGLKRDVGFWGLAWATEGSIIGGVGPFATFWVGGDGRLHLYWDMLVIAIFSVGIYHWAIANRLTNSEMDEYIGNVVVVTD
jgi:hypothetical protein